MKRLVLTIALGLLLALPVVAFAKNNNTPNENANPRAFDNPSNQNSNGQGTGGPNGNSGVGGPNSNKVTICHGTNSVNNPYVRISVDADSADGDTGNDKGQGDHSTHTGPVPANEAAAQALKDAKTAWGDIIPAHDNYGGLNWDAQGQAVYNNGCNYATVTTPPVGGPDTSSTTQGVGGASTQQGVLGLSGTSSSDSKAREAMLLFMSVGLIAMGARLSFKSLV